MSSEMRAIVEAAYAAVDRADADGLLALCADDVEMADEVGRRWLRGRVAVAEQVRRELAEIPGITSEVRDLEAREIGEVAIVTYAVTQRYRDAGRAVVVDGPGTVVLRRVHGAWRIALIQSTPFPLDE